MTGSKPVQLSSSSGRFPNFSDIIKSLYQSAGPLSTSPHSLAAISPTERISWMKKWLWEQREVTFKEHCRHLETFLWVLSPEKPTDDGVLRHSLLWECTPPLLPVQVLLSSALSVGILFDCRESKSALSIPNSPCCSPSRQCEAIEVWMMLHYTDQPRH